LSTKYKGSYRFLNSAFNYNHFLRHKIKNKELHFTINNSGTIDKNHLKSITGNLFKLTTI